ncbi:MAG: rhomboid family intramembrane serine protease [Bacteroidetes bacterium]|nr:rhomboid family intramembrane serine protease [Bacteroidota bacterium]
MLQSIWDDVRRELDKGNMITRLIIINIAVFVAINLVNLILFIANGGTPSPLYQKILHFFCMSSDWTFFLTHPWGLFTSMFLHEGFFHILWNMLFLYWFGRIVGDFIGDQRILPLYLLGGVAGGVLFFISANLLPYGAGGSFALGASAGVMAIVVAAGTISPDYIMRLLFIGDVKLKYIVAVLVFLDLILIPQGGNTGGHFAHLGGALFGYIFVAQLRSGNDMSRPVNNVLDSIRGFFERLFSGQGPRKRPKVVYRNPSKKRSRRSTKGSAASDSPSKDSVNQEKVDAILDKIKQSGYDSLTAEEKEFLFNASKKKK